MTQAQAPGQTPGRISLSLVSHTNAGKTTLARTLLGREVGEVRDAPHVTDFADDYPLIELPSGESLWLWDTPGFGDSQRLARRLRLTASPVGRFLGEAWDRWRDRPFWAAQQALRNVRDQSDVVLYLVNAAEAPEAAGYVEPEMQLLAWIGKPVIVLLNQLGAPRARALEEADVERWRRHLARQTGVVAVLPMDAFARCWVQELTLLQAVEQALPAARRPPMARLRAAWQARRLTTFEASIDALAASLGRIGAARQPMDDVASLRDRLRQLGSALGLPAAADSDPAVLAQRALAATLDAELRASTTALIALHGLAGEAQGEIMARLTGHYALRQRLGEGRAALWGGMVSGALAGLGADLASGGLTLGGGLLAGGVLGALGAAGLARGYNLVRGTDRSWLAWSAEAMDGMVEAALLRYLAVAHFGRGRGDWAQSESPPHWRELIADALMAEREGLAALWRGRSPKLDNVGEAEALAQALRPPLARAARTALRHLYPGALPPGPADDQTGLPGR